MEHDDDVRARERAEMEDAGRVAGMHPSTATRGRMIVSRFRQSFMCVCVFGVFVVFLAA